MPTQEEMELGRSIRREFSKHPIESSRLEISVIRGRIYLSGTIAPIREEVGVIVKTEVAQIVERITKMNGVKQVILECKLNETKPKENTAPGQHGHGHGPSHH